MLSFEPDTMVSQDQRSIHYTRGRQPLARERIFYGTPSDLAHVRNLPYKPAWRTPKLKLSTLHEINSPVVAPCLKYKDFD